MNLRARLGQLRGESVEQKPSLAELRARIERITAARPVRRKGMGEEELARAAGGEYAGDGLIVIDQHLPVQHRHGQHLLGADHNLLDAALAFFGHACASQAVVFFDTETTGLAGGSGTFAFVLGMARYTDAGLHVRQWLLTRMQGERGLLEGARAFLQGAGVLVSYNGKCFDSPLLQARYRLAGMADPIAPLAHWDLLAATRRAFAKRWPDCRLHTAEERLLGFRRVNDLPSAWIPEVWFRWLRHGNGAEMPRVVRHNRWDLVSLAVLARLLHECFSDPIEHACDTGACLRWWRERGDESGAYAYLLTHRTRLGTDDSLLLARLAQRRGESELACAIWRRLATGNSVEAVENLAKHCEHRTRDWPQALAFTRRLLELEPHSTRHRQRELRLARKLAAPA